MHVVRIRTRTKPRPVRYYSRCPRIGLAWISPARCSELRCCECQQRSNIPMCPTNCIILWFINLLQQRNIRKIIEVWPSIYDFQFVLLYLFEENGGHHGGLSYSLSGTGAQLATKVSFIAPFIWFWHCSDRLHDIQIPFGRKYHQEQIITLMRLKFDSNFLDRYTLDECVFITFSHKHRQNRMNSLRLLYRCIQ